MKILIIEDNPDIREEVLTWLALEDYEALGAANGRTGVELALTQQPDLILCDIMMPEKDGYRVLLELRTQPATALTPFVFMTAKQEKVDIRYGMELGADDYLTKPFSHAELLGTVRSRLTRRDLFMQQSDQRLQTMRQNLLHTLPHELRTPLVGILGIGELLGQDAEVLTPAEIAEYATMITNSGQQLYRLIENYLLYAQLETDKLNPRPLHPAAQTQTAQATVIIADTCEQVAHNYRRADALVVDVQPGVIHLSRQDLSKIVYELVDNAFKFSKAPTMVRVCGQVQAGYYQLAIADQGRGITPENVARVAAYVQFERATYEQQGLGLGLTITRQLVELAGGVLQIESIVGIGTTVRLSLPLAQADGKVRVAGPAGFPDLE